MPLYSKGKLSQGSVAWYGGGDMECLLFTLSLASYETSTPSSSLSLGFLIYKKEDSDTSIHVRITRKGM